MAIHHATEHELRLMKELEEARDKLHEIMRRPPRIFIPKDTTLVPPYPAKPAMDNPPPQTMPARTLIGMLEKRKPEPWRPTVDDWDLLPDV